MAEQIRLLACSQCKTIEELPDFEGRPEQDHLLSRLLENHGPEDNRHIGQLFKVEKDKWDNEAYKTQIAKQVSLTMAGGETGLGSEYYNIKNTYTADAFACWTKHLRNPNCSDYRSDSKRLTPNTADARREAGLPVSTSPSERSLCEFCPVHSLVVTAARKRAGAYDN